jgi:hypothetical protein
MPSFDVAALLVRVRRNGTTSSGKLGLLPSPLWGGVGGGGRSNDTRTCPQATSSESDEA